MRSHPVHEQLYPLLVIEQLRAGDIATFNKCYNLFYAPLFTIASASLNNKMEAVHVVQLAFIKCWIKQSEHSSFEYLEAFLRATVKNTCKLFNNGIAQNGPPLQLLSRILSTDVRYGLSRKELYKHVQLLSSEANQSLHELFTIVYSNRKAISEVAEETSVPVAFVQFRIDLACQVLHLIMSNEGF